MKQYKILGRKVSVLAIIMAVLLIGTASAAVFQHYATLSGTITVTNDISVTDDDGDLIPIGDLGDLRFTSPATFTINNGGDEPVIVELATSLHLDTLLVTDETGLTVDYSVIEGTGVEGGNGIGVPILVPPGGLTIDVEFDAVDNAIPGEYRVQVDVNPDGSDYVTYTGDNEMEILELSHKIEGGSEPWVAYGNISTLSFAQMGDNFYYELDATDLESTTDYTIIYYADQMNRFVNWGGVAPGVIDSFTTDVDGNYVETGRVGLDLNMDMPSASDENYPGAKIWIIPTSALSIGDTALPMDEWNPERHLYELDELTYYIDTNIV